MFAVQTPPLSEQGLELTLVVLRDATQGKASPPPDPRPPTPVQLDPYQSLVSKGSQDPLGDKPLSGGPCPGQLDCCPIGTKPPSPPPSESSGKSSYSPLLDLLLGNCKKKERRRFLAQGGDPGDRQTQGSLLPALPAPPRGQSARVWTPASSERRRGLHAAPLPTRRAVPSGALRPPPPRGRHCPSPPDAPCAAGRTRQISLRKNCSTQANTEDKSSLGTGSEKTLAPPGTQLPRGHGVGGQDRRVEPPPCPSSAQNPPRLHQPLQPL